MNDLERLRALLDGYRQQEQVRVETVVALQKEVETLREMLDAARHEQNRLEETIFSQRETIEGYRSLLRATIHDYHEQGDAIRLLQEMKVVELDAVEMGSLRDSLSTSGSALIAYDPLDRAIKIKHDGRWSPPLGHEVDQG